MELIERAGEEKDDAERFPDAFRPACPAEGDLARRSRWRNFGLPRSGNRYAYVFYATNHAYAIAVLVFFRLLRRLGIRGDADVVVLHLSLPPHLVSLMREMGMVTVLFPELTYIDYPYFRDCLNKLRIFQLIEYDRVKFVDSDAIPLKSLDTLLDLPFDGPVAAPSAYWLP